MNRSFAVAAATAAAARIAGDTPAATQLHCVDPRGSRDGWEFGVGSNFWHLIFCDVNRWQLTRYIAGLLRGRHGE
jgi:hypothetical protein